MLVSTKGRYALRVMIDLAEHYSQEFIPLKDIALRQEISLKYLERILPEIKKCGLVDTVHGKGGGYRLKKDPAEISVWEVLNVAEGDMAPVSCLSDDAAPCERAAECKTLPMWTEYYRQTREYFSGISIADLAGVGSEFNYII